MPRKDTEAIKTDKVDKVVSGLSVEATALQTAGATLFADPKDAKFVALKYGDKVGDIKSPELRATVLQNFVTIKNDLPLLFDNLVYNPGYQVPYSQVQALAQELISLKKAKGVLTDNHTKQQQALLDAMHGGKGTDHITNFIKQTPTKENRQKNLTGTISTLSDKIKTGATMLSELFSMLKTAFHDAGLGERFDKEMSGKSRYAQVAQAIEMEASKLSTTQTQVIDRFSKKIVGNGLDISKTSVDSGNVKNALEKTLFNNDKTCNPEAAKGLFDNISDTEQTKLCKPLTTAFPPATYPSWKFDPSDLMVYNMITKNNKNDPTKTQQEFAQYYNNKATDNSIAYQAFQTYFDKQATERDSSDFGNGSGGMSPNELYARAMTTSMLVNSSAADKVRASRVAKTTTELTKGQDNWIEKITIQEKDGFVIVAGTIPTDKKLLYSIDGGKNYIPYSSTGVDVKTTARPGAVLFAQEDTANIGKAHPTLTKKCELALISGVSGKSLETTRTGDRLTISNLIASKAYTYQITYTGEAASAAIPFTPTTTSYDLTIPTGKTISKLSIQEQGATEFAALKLPT